MKQFLDQDGVQYFWNKVHQNFANLSNNGKVPANQLPSYVDDVLEYGTLSTFPETGETDKIYVAQDTNLTYRWSGTRYVEISPSIALGETSTTAYPGNKGKANEEAIINEVSRAQRREQAIQDSVNEEATRAKRAEADINNSHNNHITDYRNPHKVTKAQVGLGDVDNTPDIDKPISNAQQREFNRINQSLSNNIDSVNNALLDVAKIKSTVNLLSQKQEHTKDRIDTIDSSINNINNDIAGINENIESTVSRIDSELSTKADADKYLPLTGGTMKGDILSPSYKKIGGTSEQVLLADGSIATTISIDTLNSILN